MIRINISRSSIRCFTYPEISNLRCSGCEYLYLNYLRGKHLFVKRQHCIGESQFQNEGGLRKTFLTDVVSNKGQDSKVDVVSKDIPLYYFLDKPCIEGSRHCGQAKARIFGRECDDGDSACQRGFYIFLVSLGVLIGFFFLSLSSGISSDRPVATEHGDRR